MTFLTVDVADQGTLDANGVSESLNEMFTAAILLTGNADRAECAVLKGVETLDRGPASAGTAFHATIRAAMTPAMTCEEEVRQDPAGVSWLPIELQRVLLLPKDLRHVFVLRLVLGLPRNQCSRLLRMDDRTLDEHVVRSAIFLAQRQVFTDRSMSTTSHTCSYLIKEDTINAQIRR